MNKPCHQCCHYDDTTYLDPNFNYIEVPDAFAPPPRLAVCRLHPVGVDSITKQPTTLPPCAYERTNTRADKYRYNTPLPCGPEGLYFMRGHSQYKYRSLVAKVLSWCARLVSR